MFDTFSNTQINIFSEDSTLRRKLLIPFMDQLTDENITCNGCDSRCCSFHSNSMMITPIETFDLLIYLQKQQRLNKFLIEKLKKVIEKQRLDYFQTPKGIKILRKNYTCPFFDMVKTRCTISPEFKPYGCLGFNPIDSQSSAIKNCYSNINLLEKQSELNDKLKEGPITKRLQNIFWIKTPIPTAIYDLYLNLNKTN